MKESIKQNINKIKDETNFSFFRLIKLFFVSFLMICVCAALGLLFLYLAYCIPIEPIQENAEKYATMLESEGPFPSIVFEHNCTLDNNTDALEVLQAQDNTNESTLNKAIFIFRHEFNEDFYSRIYSILHHCDESDPLTPTKIYAKFWHGYLIVLKPLLFFFDGYAIRLINGLFQVLCVFLLCFLLYKKKLKSVILPVLISYLLFKPLCTALCLDFSPCFYSAIIGSILVLIKPKKLSIELVFVFVGIFTNYFSLLIYPIVSFCFPCVVYLAICNKETVSSKCLNIFICLFFWLVGYYGMWIAKWVLISILTDWDGFRIAYDGAAPYIYGAGVKWFDFEIPYLTTVVLMYGLAVLTPYFILVVAIIAKSIIDNYHKANNKFFCKTNFYNMLPYLIVACVPVLWYLFNDIHSYMHFGFTFKTAISTFFALMTYFSFQVKIDKIKLPKK